MKRILTIGALTAVLLSPSALFSAEKWTVKAIEKKYPLKIEKSEPKNGLIIHRAVLTDGPNKDSKVQFFVTDNQEAIIFGNAFDSNGNEIVIPVNMAEFNGKEGLVYGNGKEHYYVWTDPECPYCKKFELKMEALKDKATFHVYFFPLSFHKNAMAMSTHVLNQKNDTQKAKALFDTARESKDYQKAAYKADELKKLEAEVQKQMNLGKQMGVNGTPAVFDSKGQKINWSTL